MQVILLGNEEQLEKLYLHESSDLSVQVQGEGVERKDYPVRPPADAPDYRQFVAHWVRSESGVQLKTDKVVREGIYPKTEEELKEALERDRRNAEKAFAVLEKEFMKARKK